jgi:uncharacterized membrane protein
MMIGVLALILLVLMASIGGSRGIKAFLSIISNFLILAAMILGMLEGGNIILIAILGCLVITLLTLSTNVGFNRKSLAALISVGFVLAATGVLSAFLVSSARIGGFSTQEYTSICMYDWNVGISMADAAIAVVLIKITGAMIDTSVSVSSFLWESKRLDPDIPLSKLFHSGMNVGRDILGTTTNTLYFAFLGSFMMLLVWFMLKGSTVSYMLNTKVFIRELARILSSGLSCILIIPVSAFVSTYLLQSNTFLESH